MTSPTNQLQQENKYANIVYKKQNPFIFNNQSSNKKFHIWYNFSKFFICIVTFVFSLLALWYATQWKTSTLSNLGLDLQNKYHLAAIDSFTPVWDANWDKLIDSAKTLSLGEWSSSSVNSAMIDALIALSFVGIIAIIPTLVFKNGTVFSVASLIITFSSFVILLAFFSRGASSQNVVTMVYSQSEITSLYSQLQTTTNKLNELNNIQSPDVSVTQQINDLTAKANELITKINEVINKEVPQILKNILGKI